MGDAGELVVLARPNWKARHRCGVCGRRCPGYDHAHGPRRWRPGPGDDVCVGQAQAPRVSCGEHGIVVVGVPWARHDLGAGR